MSSNIRIKTICEHCGNEFIAKTTKTRYCSHLCNKRDYKKRVKNQKVSREIEFRNNKAHLEAIGNREYLAVKDAAVLIGCSTKTIYRLVNDGTIKGVNLSKRLTRINRQSLKTVIPQE